MPDVVIQLPHAATGFAIRIGGYLLARGETPGTVQITNDDGESGEFPAGELESAIAEYFNRAF